MVAFNSSTLKALVSRLKRKPIEVVALDIATSGVKVVRVKKTNEQLELVAADILPALSFPHTAEAAVQEVTPLALPDNLVARYASFAVSGENWVVKLLSVPGQTDHIQTNIEQKVTESMGLSDPAKYRIGYKIITESHGRSEFRGLVVALPEAVASAVCMLLPSGRPAPYSVEISGLATMTAFLHGPGEDQSGDALALVEFGARVSFFSVFRRMSPILIRKFDCGAELILSNVQKSLGVDRVTAEGILADGSFDISQQMSGVMDGFVKQVIVSRDFVERRENCRVSKVYAAGGITASRDWMLQMKSAMGFEIGRWNPFDCLQVGQNAFPDRLKGQETRFCAAVGAALATLAEEKE